MKELVSTLAQPKFRVPLATALGFGVVGAYYYFVNKNPSKSLVMDFLIPGATVAVGFNLIGWLATDMGWVPVIESAKPNGDLNDMGRLPKAAIEFLSNINPAELYADMKSMGLKIAPIPDNPSIVTQDMD